MAAQAAQEAPPESNPDGNLGLRMVVIRPVENAQMVRGAAIAPTKLIAGVLSVPRR